MALHDRVWALCWLVYALLHIARVRAHAPHTHTVLAEHACMRFQTSLLPLPRVLQAPLQQLSPAEACALAAWLGQYPLLLALQRFR